MTSPDDAETEGVAGRLTPEQAALVERIMAMVAKLPRMEIDSDDPTGFLYDEHGRPC